MRIIQILPTLAFGDAIGNHTIALAQAFTRNGIENRIYPDAIDGRLPKGTAEQFEAYEERDGDVILYHMSTGSRLNREILKFHGKKLLNYHNITPAHYFHGILERAEQSCMEAREDLEFLADKVDGCVSDSAYNQSELEALGYHCPMKAIPILIAFDDYRKEPDEETMTECHDGRTNILFVGRVVPNKKHENLLEAFYYYHKNYDPSARLILAGSYAGADSYAYALKQYAYDLGVDKDVVFTGQISFPAILAYYRRADIFLCMSEHEGFCVPLVEAMYFGVPIIACESTAIGDTLGGAGILLQSRNPLETAGMMNYVRCHEELRERIVSEEKRRLADFSHERVEEDYITFIRQFG